jgi:hypothetical protein
MTDTIPIPLSEVAQTVDVLRNAATVLRTQSDSTPVTLAVAAWLDDEATVLHELLPFTQMMSAFVHDDRGGQGSIAFGFDNAAELAIRVSTVSSALVVARTVLDTLGDEA